MSDSGFSKLARVWRDETSGWHGRLLLAQMLAAPLPVYVGSRVRAALLRGAGFRIGAGTVFWGMPTLTGTGDIYSRLSIGRECWVNLGMLINLGAEVSLGDRVAVGHEVMILTESQYHLHQWTPGEFRRLLERYFRVTDYQASPSRALPIRACFRCVQR